METSGACSAPKGGKRHRASNYPAPWRPCRPALHSGLLNGVFGEGDDRHIARWRSVKHVTEFHEEEGNTKIIRRREKWSNELRLLYVTGKVMKLTEKAPTEGDGDGECTSEDGTP